jgi:hypothetical protein
VALTAQLYNFSPPLPECLTTGQPSNVEPPGPVRPTPAPVRGLRQHQHRLETQQVLQLVAAYVAGATVQDLTQQFAIHRTTVLEHLKRQGVARRPHRRKLTEQDVAKAVRLYQAGWSTTRLGPHFGVNAETVRKELHRAGVTLRPAWGR